MMKKIILITIILGFFGCNNKPEQTSKLENVPPWAKEAVWYQIFPERFNNADPSNDPQPGDMEGAWMDGRIIRGLPIGTSCNRGKKQAVMIFIGMPG
jgi:uncharacterized lipoprotein NlpE involved in copper resistance